MSSTLRPRGVHGRLMVALGALVGLTLLAGVTGWHGFTRTETALETLQADSLSDLSLVLTVAERSASLAARAPYIAELRSERQIAAGRAEIEARLAEFTELAISLPRLNEKNIPRPTDVPSAVRLAARLEGILRALLDVTGERLAADAGMTHALTALADFRNSAKRVEDTSSDPNTLSASLVARLGDVSELVLEASAAETVNAVEEIRERFAKTAKSVESELAFGPHASLNGKIDALEPIFVSRLRQLSTRNRSEVLLAAINTASAQLTATVSSLADVVRSSALMRSEETISVLRFGKSALLAVAGLCLLAALGAASFVMRDVATNLRRATGAMTRLAAGDRSAEVPGVERQDELGDLARAFDIFKRQAIEREELSEKLADNAKTLQAIFDNLSDGISLFNSQGRLIAWNPRFTELSGLNPGEIREGVSMPELLERLSATNVKARTVDGRSIDLPRFARGRIAPFAVLELHTPDGRTIEIRAGAMPKGGVIASLTDLTDRKALQQQLQQAQKMEAVGQLTGGIAHDFNNRLAAIVGNLQLIHDDDSASQKLKSRSLRALEAAEGGAAMTQRLLSFARRQALLPQVTDLNDLVESLNDLLGYSLDPGIELLLDLDRAIPPVMVDPAQMENALFNLVFNSRDAIDGRGQITITTRSKPDAQGGTGEVAIFVSDTGSGMTADVRARVLEPFFTTKPFGRGSGLGLSMVYGFVRQSGGRIEIESAPSKGTSIELRFPAANTARLPEPAKAAAISPPQANGERILVVEDEDLVRETAVDMLSSLGYLVTAVSNADDALESIRAENFDLLFTDVVLAGGVNGPELAEHALKVRPRLPVLFCSGFMRQTPPDRPSPPMPERILEKPYRRETLALRVREVLNDARLQETASGSTGASNT
ncbi:PAS-domain containing protein [Rhizobiales bacterium]|uniref:ATP-binding protein n=1 Tax=Hongsoonwoonella zoysiae TaxID=2821844 RepID=UPI00155FF52D|nr:ATP-binding protein [Hongsoonwoonella zoysiae]NRG16601.1 PAS-domain containing protein [Hongsoonwoonella zoysiae]